MLLAGIAVPLQAMYVVPGILASVLTEIKQVVSFVNQQQVPAADLTNAHLSSCIEELISPSFDDVMGYFIGKCTAIWVPQWILDYWEVGYYRRRLRSYIAVPRQGICILPTWLLGERHLGCNPQGELGPPQVTCIVPTSLELTREHQPAPPHQH